MTKQLKKMTLVYILLPSLAIIQTCQAMITIKTGKEALGPISWSRDEFIALSGYTISKIFSTSGELIGDIANPLSSLTMAKFSPFGNKIIFYSLNFAILINFENENILKLHLPENEIFKKITWHENNIEFILAKKKTFHVGPYESSLNIYQYNPEQSTITLKKSFDLGPSEIVDMDFNRPTCNTIALILMSDDRQLVKTINIKTGEISNPISLHQILPGTRCPGDIKIKFLYNKDILAISDFYKKKTKSQSIIQFFNAKNNKITPLCPSSNTPQNLGANFPEEIKKNIKYFRKGKVSCMESRHDNTLAISIGNDIHIIDQTTGKTIHILAGDHKILHIKHSQNGKYIASLDINKTLKIWKTPPISKKLKNQLKKARKKQKHIDAKIITYH